MNNHLGGEADLKNWKLRNKMIMILFFCFLVMTISVLLNLKNEKVKNEKTLEVLELNIRESYDMIIRNQIDTIIGVMDGIFQKAVDGKVTLEEAKIESAEMLRWLKYGKDGYFWADTVDGVNIVLYGSDVEGTNRINYQDERGNYVVQETIRLALSGGGYYDYLFTKQGETKAQEKRSFSVYYKPYGWVIGTGIYTSDVDKIIYDKQKSQSEEMKANFSENMSIILILFSGVIIFMFFMVNSITEPLKFTSHYASQIAEGDYLIEMPLSYLKRRDEVGVMSSALFQMKKAIASSIMEKELSNEQLLSEKEFLNTVLITIGDGIIVTDEEQKIQMVNMAAVQMIGIDDKQLIGTTGDQFVTFVDYKTQEKLKSLISLAIESKKIVERQESYMTIGARKMLVEDSASPILDRQKNLTGIVYVFRNITDSMKRKQEIEFLSYHDQLTGLFNRRYFEEISTAILEEKNLPLSLIIGDLNALKLTNDAFGHLKGDQMITAFSDVLKSSFSPKAIVARIGGDEFAIILPNTSPEQADLLIMDIRLKLKGTSVGQVPVTAAFGHATVSEISDSFSNIFRLADEAMYNQKLLDHIVVKKTIVNRIALENNHRQKGKKDEIRQSVYLIGDFLKYLDMDETMIKKMRKAAFVYDIGYVTVPNSVIKNNMSLTEKDWEEVKAHPVSGYNILKNIDHYAENAEDVLTHHEWFNGSGYPRGLAGKNIPFGARILALVTDYVAMIHERPYREAMTMEEACQLLQEESGKRYDPEFVVLFLEFLKMKDTRDT